MRVTALLHICTLHQPAPLVFYGNLLLLGGEVRRWWMRGLAVILHMQLLTGIASGCLLVQHL